MTTPTTSRLDHIAAVIARSPIAVCGLRSGVRLSRLPDGFDAVDLAILDWLVAEGRRIGRTVARI